MWGCAVIERIVKKITFFSAGRNTDDSTFIQQHVLNTHTLSGISANSDFYFHLKLSCEDLEIQD